MSISSITPSEQGAYNDFMRLHIEMFCHGYIIDVPEWLLGAAWERRSRDDENRFSDAKRFREGYAIMAAPSRFVSLAEVMLGFSIRCYEYSGYESIGWWFQEMYDNVVLTNSTFPMDGVVYHYGLLPGELGHGRPCTLSEWDKLQNICKRVLHLS